MGPEVAAQPSTTPVGVLLLNSLLFAGQGSERVAAVAWLTAGIVVLKIMSGAFLEGTQRPSPECQQYDALYMELT